MRNRRQADIKPTVAGLCEVVRAWEAQRIDAACLSQTMRANQCHFRERRRMAVMSMRRPVNAYRLLSVIAE
jgi:hypothetical protein